MSGDPVGASPMPSEPGSGAVPSWLREALRERDLNPPERTFPIPSCSREAASEDSFVPVGTPDACSRFSP